MDEWPVVSDARTLSFDVAPTGLVRSENFVDGEVASEYEYDHTVGIHSIERTESSGPDKPDVTPDDNRSLVFETDPLQSPVELTGNGEMTVRFRATTSDPVLAVRVNDISPDGTSRPVTCGHIQTSHRNGHESPEELIPDEEYEITIPLKPKSHLFETGHRIRVAISAAFFPRARPSLEHGSYTIFSTPASPTNLEFPGLVHSDEDLFGETIEMDGPDDEEIPAQSPYIVDSDSDIKAVRVESDEQGDSASYIVTESSHLDLPHGSELTTDHEFEASVDATDPGRMEMQKRIRLELELENERFEVETTGRITRDVAHLSTTVSLNGSTVFEQNQLR
jgi:predicted acyl esterase